MSDENLIYDPFDHGNGPQEGFLEISEDTPPNLYHECAERFLEHSDRRDAFICGFKGNKYFAYEVTLLAHNKFHLLGVDDDVKLARRHGVTKAHVNKVKMDYLRMSGLLEKMGQRDEVARKNFADARKLQLA